MLADGEICDCAGAQAAQSNEVTQPNAAVQPNETVQPNVTAQTPQSEVTMPNGTPDYNAGAYQSAPNPNIEKSKAYLADLFATAKAIFAEPYNAGSQMAGRCRNKIAWGFIGLYSVIVALFVCVYAGKYNSFLGGFAVLDQDIALQIQSFKFSIPTVFVVTALLTCGMACLTAAILMMFVKLFKGETTYKHMLCVASIASLFKTPFVLLGAIVRFFKSLPINAKMLSDIGDFGDLFESVAGFGKAFVGTIYVPIIIATFGALLSKFCAFTVLPAATSLKKDRAPYVMFLTSIVASIALGIAVKYIMPICLPTTIRAALNQINLNSLLNGDLF